MAAVYSKRLIQAQALNGSASFTVPAGYTCVVRDLDAFVASGGSGAGLFLIGAGGQTMAAYNSIGSAFAVFAWRGRQVLEAGETVTVTTTGPCDVTVSGYLLEA